MNLIICGAPGSGKGTQSDFIVEKYKLTHLSTGDLLRAETASGSELGKTINAYISEGNLIPDDMMIELLMQKIKNEPETNGFILDGFPRTVAQAEAFERIMAEQGHKTDLLIDLKVERDELVNRLLKRGETSGRSDDNLATITKRLEVYEEKTRPVSDFYQKLGKYAAIDGMGDLQEIFGRICQAIDRIQ